MHGPVGRVPKEHIASGGVWTDGDRPAPMNTKSGSRKLGTTSKAQHNNEEVFFDKANEWINGKT